MAEFNVSVNIGSEQVVFQNGEEIPFISKAKAIPGVCNMFVNKSVDICPNSECIIPVALDENLPENIDVIFEPLDLKECIGVTPARVITTVRNGKACVLVMNVSDSNNHLPEGTRLGHGYVITGDPEDLYSLVDDGEPEVEPPYPAKGDDNPLQFDLSETDLTTDEVHEAKALLEEFSDIFSKNNTDFGRTDVVSHAIKTGDTPPVKQRAYRSSPKIREEIQKQCDNLLDNGLIEESFSPWSSPIVMVKKKDGTYRFLCNYSLTLHVYH